MANALLKVREIWRRLGIGQEQTDPRYFHEGVIPVDVVGNSAPAIPWPETPVAIAGGIRLAAAGNRAAIRLLSGRNGCRVLLARFTVNDLAGGAGVAWSVYKTALANNFTLVSSLNMNVFQPIDGAAFQAQTAAYYANNLGCRVEEGTASTDLYTSTIGSGNGSQGSTFDIANVVLGANMALQFQTPRVGASERIGGYFVFQPFIGNSVPEFQASLDS